MLNFRVWSLLLLSVAASSVVCAAEPDGMNYCSPPPSPPSPPSLEQLRPAYEITQAVLRRAATRPVRAGEPLADVELRLSPGRRLAASSEALGLDADVHLSAMRLPTESFVPTFLLYCAVSDRSSLRAPPRLQTRSDDRDAVCLRDFPADGNAEAAYFARMRGLALGQSQWLAGSVHFSAPLATNQALRERVNDQTFRTTISVEAVEIREQLPVSIWNRAGFKEVTVSFLVEGVETVSLRLFEPLRVGDGWLVVTDLSPAREVVVEHMSHERWLSFHASKCASTAPQRAP